MCATPRMRMIRTVGCCRTCHVRTLYLIMHRIYIVRCRRRRMKGWNGTGALRAFMSSFLLFLVLGRRDGKTGGGSTAESGRECG